LRTRDLFEFVRERHAVYERRAAGLPKPWTQDKILQSYRFCNVYRERDAVTTWLRTEWREPHHDDPDLWFAFVVARCVNEPATLAEIEFPVPWDRDAFLDVVGARKRRGQRIFNPAYMISTSGREAADKATYLADYVFTPMWQQRVGLRPRVGDTLTAYHVLLGQLYGLASFLAAQVVADIKHVEPLLSATDHETFCASGPGSRRGLNRLMGYPVKAGWNEDNFRQTLLRVRDDLNPLVIEAGMPPLDAQDVQGSFCELDKYLRAKTGDGRPKQLYPGS
jgi:hypothetical protein